MLIIRFVYSIIFISDMSKFPLNTEFVLRTIATTLSVLLLIIVIFLCGINFYLDKYHTKQELNKEIDLVSEETELISEELDSISEELDSISEETDSIGEETNSIGEELDSISEELDSIGEELDSIGKETNSIGEETDSIDEETQQLFRTRSLCNELQKSVMHFSPNNMYYYTLFSKAINYYNTLLSMRLSQGDPNFKLGRTLYKLIAKLLNDIIIKYYTQKEHNSLHTQFILKHAIAFTEKIDESMYSDPELLSMQATLRHSCQHLLQRYVFSTASHVNDVDHTVKICASFPLQTEQQSYDSDSEEYIPDLHGYGHSDTKLGRDITKDGISQPNEDEIHLYEVTYTIDPKGPFALKYYVCAHSKFMQEDFNMALHTIGWPAKK